MQISLSLRARRERERSGVASWHYANSSQALTPRAPPGGSETKKVFDAKGACIDGAAANCIPYACADSTKCATTCTADAQCAPGFKCQGGVCAVPASNTCSADLLSTVGPSGAPRSCGAFRCEKETGECLKI